MLRQTCLFLSGDESLDDAIAQSLVSLERLHEETTKRGRKFDATEVREALEIVRRFAIRRGFMDDRQED